MARPAISDERVIIEGPESIHIKLKTAWSDGTHSLLFTPSEFLERLFALIPAPKFHTTRYYGVLASRCRIGDIYQTSQLHSSTPTLGPMGRIQVYHLQVPHGVDPPTIATTLRALGLPVRAPPIAPARSRRLISVFTSCASY